MKLKAFALPAVILALWLSSAAAQTQPEAATSAQPVADTAPASVPATNEEALSPLPSSRAPLQPPAGEKRLKKAEPPLPLVTDPARIDSKLRQVLERPEYLRKKEQDTFAKLQDLVFSWLQSLPETLAGFPYADQLHRLTYFVMWTILVGVFISTGYWVWRVIRLSKVPLLDITSTAVGTRFFAVPETYDPRITQAVTSGAWGEAMLYRWRKFLSSLESKDIVKADRTQTNWEYANQILRHNPAEATRETLLSLVRTYDLYIYGEARLDESGWQAFRERVDEAEHQLARLAEPPAPGSAGSSPVPSTP